MMLNEIVIGGNLTRDIELKKTGTGTSVAQFTLALNSKFKDKDGNQKEEVSFISCVGYGKTAELASEYLHKGSPAIVVGRLKQESWEKDGETKSKTVVICERIVFVGSKKDE
jgi:single-strand DNA-binding protein